MSACAWNGLGLCAASLLSASASAQGGRPLFQGTQYDVGDGAAGLVLHDFDGDGILDAVCANRGAPAGDLDGDGVSDVGVDVTMLRGDGKGGFVTRADFPAGLGPVAVAAGDVDEDGLADVASADEVGDTVSILLGDGAGALGAPTAYSMGDAPRSVLLADLDDDGHLDVATADYQSGSLSIRYGDGAGGFGARLARYAPDATTVVAGDVDRDGVLDLVYTHSGFNEIGLRFGPAFTATQTFAMGSQPTAVAMGDISEDGWLDVVTANHASNNVSVRFGNPGGGFPGSFLGRTSFAAGTKPLTVLLADLDGDGHLDIATGNDTDSASSTVQVLRNNGSGAFLAATSFAGGLSPLSIAAGDLDRDGRLDLATAVTFDDEWLYKACVTVLRGNGQGGFPGRTDLALAAPATAIMLGDLDGDGRLDLATAQSTAGQVTLRAGDGAGGFGSELAFPCGTGPESLALGDLDADGHVDVVAGRYASGNAVVLRNDGTGEFQTPVAYANGRLMHALVLGDLNSDAALDLVSIHVDTPYQLGVRLGDGLGAFGARAGYPNGYGADLALADLDGDGNLDVAVGRGSWPGETAVFRGNGLGGFGTPVVFATTGSTSIVAGDWNEDGRVDLVTSDLGGITLLLGDGAGGFSSRVDMLLRSGTVESADVNGDGNADLVASDGTSYSSRARVLLGDGNGGFPVRRGVSGLGAPLSIALGDLNGDRQPELVASTGGPVLSVFANAGKRPHIRPR